MDFLSLLWRSLIYLTVLSALIVGAGWLLEQALG